ncbi:ISAs1 family transposase [Photobacterium sp. GJ3]|nr:ISAs1 family transposase [Photobacterium sp. GJ3]
MNDQRTTQNKPVIAFDGKILRSAYRGDKKDALQLVTAYDTERGLVLSQKPAESKNGEISVVRQLIDIINLKGSIITLDKISNKQHTLSSRLKTQPKLREAVVSQFQAVFDAQKE